MMNGPTYHRIILATNLSSLLITAFTVVAAWSYNEASSMLTSNQADHIASRNLQEECCTCTPTFPPSIFTDSDCSNGDDDAQRVITFVKINFQGRPRDVTTKDLALLEEQYVIQYNALGAPSCREILSADIHEQKNLGRNLQLVLGGKNMTTVTRPFSFLYRITWKCSVCGGNDKLFIKDAVDRHLQEDAPAPVESDFSRSYDSALAVFISQGELDSIDEVTNVNEFEEQFCVQEISNFETMVNVVFDGGVETLDSTTDFSFLEMAFKNTYNQLNVLNEATCDLFFRHVESATIVGSTSGNTISFEVNFSCHGCFESDGLFDEGRRLEMMKDTEIFESHISRAVQSVEQDCICDPDAGIFRAPTLTEFKDAYTTAVAILIIQADIDLEEAGGVGEVSLDTPAPTPTPTLPPCLWPDLSNCDPFIEYGNPDRIPVGGSIPTNVGLWTQLTYLGLTGNELTGTIPSEIGLLSDNLLTLRLTSNMLIGSLPSEVGLMTALTKLVLDENSFTGNLPTELGNLVNLVDELNLSFNSHTGPLPTELGNLSNLKLLSVHGNALTGPIPTELGNLASSTWIRLYNNQLTGMIPPILGSIETLTRLDVYGNDITGSTPTSICERFVPGIDCDQVRCTCPRNRCTCGNV